jgi:predicted Fe-Mo cluster-binding NifX family protein
MKIAIPVNDEVLFGHFGGAKSFYFAEVDDASKTIVSEEVVLAPEHVPGAFPKFLRDNNAIVVIAQGMGASAKAALAESGIAVLTGVAVDTARNLVERYLAGELESRDVECNHDHHGESHC